MDVDVLMKKDKNVAAAYIHAECCRTSIPETLHGILDILLNPLKNIDEWDTIVWCKWLMAGGCTPDEFTANVRKYDNATTCGLVWTANFVAYRCRTCGISPCMSLCAECFQRGNHKGHDFNMFRSQAGGACDCGDTNVMKEAGFCYLHGPHAHEPNRNQDCGIPPDLLSVAIAMMPRLILRLIQHMRQHSNSLSGFLGAVDAADKFITMLHEMSSMGAAMRQVMTHALTNPQVYKSLTEISEDSVPAEYFEFMNKSKRSYEEALTSLPNPEPPEEYKDIPSLQRNLVHKTFLEEFVFWTAKFEFPQKIVCLLLNLLPDADYKEAFTRAFVLHYSRISQLLVQCQNPDMLSNRVVHVSVQLFSNEKLALKMTEQMKLLHVMVISLKYMMSKITIPSTLYQYTNSHRVVDCGNLVMKDHCYWPLVSDLNNILSHRPVALKFLEDDGLLKMWFSFLSLFQGMNVNHREMNQHVEYEPTTYYAAFSAELEASASPMWALLAHLKDSSTAHLTKNLLQNCRFELRKWLDSVNGNVLKNDDMQVSFHFPLHRYFSVFLYQGVRNQGLSLNELLPPADELQAMIQHPLRVQSGFYEIISGLWVRNGLQIKGQAMTYIQCHFCNSMVDADLYLLQVAMMNLQTGDFIHSVLEKFHILPSLSVSSNVSNAYLEPDQEMLMMENCLVFLSALCSVRTSIGMKDADLVTMEMITLLCMGDKTHSQLMELMPERCGNSSQTKDFESVLAKVADYRAPNFESSGNMLQGMYVPKAEVWEQIYDPIYVLLRAVHRREFQTSLDRYTEHAKQVGSFRGAGTLWPPFRIPDMASAPYQDPRHLLLSRVIQGVIFVILYKAVHTMQLSDQMVSLAVYLLEMALTVCEPNDSEAGIVSIQRENSTGRYDMDFTTWYSTDNLLANLKTEIDSVLVKNSVATSGPSDVADISVNEMEVGSFDEVEMLEPFEIEIQGSELMENPLAIMPPAFEQTAGQGTQPRPAAEPLQSVVTSAIITGVGAIGAQINSISGNLTRLLSNQGHARMTQEVAVEAMAHDALRAVREARHNRNMQLVLSTPKPVVPVQKMEVERSLSRGESGYAVEIMLEESIISLLLKLHSKLSASPDSYVPFWQTEDAKRLIADANRGVENGLQIIFDSNGVASYSYSQLFEILHQSPAAKQRVGDGTFFISQVLDLIGVKDESSRNYILSTKSKLWPKNAENEEECRLREEQEFAHKKRMAAKRRERLMKEMAEKQKAFVNANKDHTFEDDEKSNGASHSEQFSMDDDSELNDSHLTIKPIEYDCVICNQSSPSTASNPIGLVILLQASSALGHRRRKGSKMYNLPVSDEEKEESQAVKDKMNDLNEQRLEEFQTLFGDGAWLMAISGGWEGGVHVQTCGHHLHYNCLKDYLNSLKSQQRQHNISIDRGEYSCPLCRQLANSFLPLSPEFGHRMSAIVKDRKGNAEPDYGSTNPELPPSPEATIALEVVKLLREYPFPTVHCALVDAMTRTMEEMTNATALRYRKIGSSTSTKSILLFVNSIARTNLELEVVLRGGNLVTPTDPQPSTSSGPPIATAVSKRSCIVPLLHVLGVHYRILSADISPKIWERILGIRFKNDVSMMKPERDVPMLLRDPLSLLLHLLMQIPINVDLAYYTCLVQGIYNLAYTQVLCVLSCHLKEQERESWKIKSSNTAPETGQLSQLFGTVIGCLESSQLYRLDSEITNYLDSMFQDSCYASTSQLGRNDIEDVIEFKLKQLLLPFLRVAALIRHHIYEQDLPFVSSKDEEFNQLSQFLALGGTENRLVKYANEPRAHDYLFWIVPNPMEVVWTWCADLCNLFTKNLHSSRFLVETQYTLWEQPRLLELSQAYDAIFQYYHRKQCTECSSVPKDPSICLVCGTLVCLRESCCKNASICEATKHSIDCGAGTAIYLCVSSSTIVVIRGKRACLWGSVYLDCFGEEDRELKRGKPLFISKDRYALLKQQWLTHRFDHTARKWIFHRDTL